MSNDFAFGDFCLTCDSPTEGGRNFCSQACRMAELDHYTNSAPASPTYYAGYSMARPAHRKQSTHSAFSLPPAYNFSRHRSTSSSSLSISAESSTATTSPKASSKMSEQVKNDLRDYVGSFDHTRTLRRRVSMQSQSS